MSTKLPGSALASSRNASRAESASFRESLEILFIGPELLDVLLQPAQPEKHPAVLSSTQRDLALFQDFMFLTAAIQKGDDFLRIQQETHTANS